MHSSSSALPRFGGPSIVCTALTGDRAGNLVHRTVSDTTSPKAIQPCYKLVPK